MAKEDNKYNAVLFTDDEVFIPVNAEKQTERKVKNLRLLVDFEMDTNYWSITPHIAINRHVRVMEIEFLCFGIIFTI